MTYIHVYRCVRMHICIYIYTYLVHPSHIWNIVPNTAKDCYREGDMTQWAQIKRHQCAFCIRTCHLVSGGCRARSPPTNVLT